MEISSLDMIRMFQSLVSKYKIIKEENDKLDKSNLLVLEQINYMDAEYKNLQNETKEKDLAIETYKEIVRCVVDSTVNTVFLNTNNQENNQLKTVEKSSSYILCEPVPSFVKFIKKLTK